MLPVKSTMPRFRSSLAIAGLPFVGGCLILFLASEPAMRGLILGAIALGVLIASILHLIHRSSPGPESNYIAEQEYPHPGITINRIRFGGGFAGLLFTLGTMAIFLTGLPLLWYPFVGAVALGAGIATVLHFLHR